MKLLTRGTALASLTFLCCVTVADVHVASRDYTTGIFTVCSDDEAVPKATLDAQAAKVCQGSPNPRVLRCADHITGSAGSSWGHFAGSSDVVGNCCEYQCPLGRDE